ncbi:restriction endonuclease subunit S [Lentilactobacillus otakiensis]|uniref:restriction endonuclease subunit S n=1 Tax=Lentilactobacillus otakiensis TaxID=481720 RepID=UPI003D16ABFB
MKDNQAKYPQLRFKGFTDPWEQRKLGEIFLERKSRSSDGELISVTIKTGVVKANDLNRRDNSSFDKSNYKTVQKGDIAYNSMRMWQGASGYSPFNGILSPAYTVLKPKSYDVNSEFFAYMFKKKPMLQCFQRSSQGLTSDTWNLKYPALSSIQVKVPSVEEQIKIAGLFKKVDHLIALHQRKLAMLKELKQGYLQKLFPQNGSKFPQLRFAGFADAWEERKLGQYTKLITKGTTPKDKTGIGDVNFVKVENITNGKIYPINKIKQNEHDNYLKRSRLEEKDILFSIAGTLGRTAIVNKSILPANTNQALAIIRGYDFDTNFLITSLAGNVVKKYIRRNPTVGAQPNLSLEQVGNLLVNTPNAEEQQKIGSFFKQLDDTIALHQRKLEKLQELKKGYLQKMFC